MTAKPGMYVELIHDRPQDYTLMRDLGVGGIVVMQPDAGKVAKVWEAVRSLNPTPFIILRKWEWDDGRDSETDPGGVYQRMREAPASLGVIHAHQWHAFIVEMRQAADLARLSLPPDDRIICHLINEPDTNGADNQRNIDAYTVAAVEVAQRLTNNGTKITLGCYNFGTGHPAELTDRVGVDWLPFAESLAAIKAAGMWVFTHEYYNTSGITHPDMNPWHVLRHWSAPLTGLNVAVTEWGLEQLVNGLEPDHHGWQGRISAQQFADDYAYYLTHTAPFVRFVCIFASDLADRVWNSFDPGAASAELVEAVKRLDQGGVPLPPGPDEPDAPLPPPTPPQPADLTLIKPCDGTVTQRFGEAYGEYMARYGIPGHNGLDIANEEGTPIKAISGGTVKMTGTDADYGQYTRIFCPQHKFHVFFAHLLQVNVVQGQTVNQGQVIGLMGNTGNSSGPHLHIEIRLGEEFSYAPGAYGHGKGRVEPTTVYWILNKESF